MFNQSKMNSVANICSENEGVGRNKKNKRMKMKCKTREAKMKHILLTYVYSCSLWNFNPDTAQHNTMPLFYFSSHSYLQLLIFTCAMCISSVRNVIIWCLVSSSRFSIPAIIHCPQTSATRI